MNKNALEELKTNYSKEYLTDIENVKIDGFLSPEELLEECTNKIENPYHFKSGKVEIEVCYDENTTQTVKDSLKDYFYREK